MVAPSAGTGGGSAGSSGSTGPSGSVSISGGVGSSTGGEESSTGPSFVGPGCGEPPACDRGIYEGHAIIESAADLAALEGFTEVTGMVEIRDSDDLVCLDMLACLERVGLDLRVQSNAALRSTAGLAKVGEVGAEHGKTWVGPGHIIVSDNPALEDLSGFAVSGVQSLVLWRNASLVTVSGFAAVSRAGDLVIRENPELESLTGLVALESVSRCGVTHNPNLCFRDFVSASCGNDPGGSSAGWVAFNDPACADEPGPRGTELTGSDECDQLSESCPAGQKCVVTNGYYGDAVCRPIVEDPDAPGEPCSVFGDPRDAFDSCEKHSSCFPYMSGPRCASTMLSWTTCPDSKTVTRVNGNETDFRCTENCDPTASVCAAGGCVPFGSRFLCVPVEPGPGEAGEACEAPNGCASGFACVQPELWDGCDSQGLGCCLPYCNTQAPECPQGLTCASWWAGVQGHPMLPYQEHFGLCVGDQE